jgi:hypothetical protein
MSACNMTIKKIVLDTVSGKELRERMKGVKDTDKFIVFIEKYGPDTTLLISGGSIEAEWKKPKVS